MLVTQLCLTFCNPMDCSLPGSSVHDFSRKEYWSGSQFLSPGALPDPGIELSSPALQADSLLSEPPGKPQNIKVYKGKTFTKLSSQIPTRTFASLMELRNEYRDLTSTINDNSFPSRYRYLCKASLSATIAIKDKYWNNKLNLKPDMKVSNHKSFKNNEVYSITLFPLKI